MAGPLKIGILSITPLKIKPGINSVVLKRDMPNVDDLMLKRSAEALGHSVKVYFNYHFQFTFDVNNPSLLYKNKLFVPPDVMIIRAGILADVDQRLSIVKQLQLMGIQVVNHYLPIVRAKNKVRTLQILSHNGVAIPKTVVVSNLQHLDSAINQFSRFPLIIKTANGSLGNGVSILESRRSLRSIVGLVETKEQILIQEYVKEAKGKDIRVFIVGGKIVATMERRAKRGDFRANFHQGGTVSQVELTDDEKSISLKAADLIGLDVAGVDVIRTSEGPKILEVNSNPGLEGITQATNIDVAGYIVQFAEKVAIKKRSAKGKHAVVMSA